MADGPMVYTHGFFSIGPSGTEVDLSDHIESIEITDLTEAKETTRANANKARTRAAGMVDWSAKVTLIQDYASGEVDATLYARRGQNDTAMTCRPENGAVAVNNPQWAGSCIMTEYNPAAHQVGEVVKATATLLGNGLLARTTS
jgi:hypothetical protein